MNTINPEVKKGDKVILRKGINNNNHFEGVALEVTHVYNVRNFKANGYFSVKAIDGIQAGTTYIYCNTDEYTFVDRQTQAKYCRDKIKALKKEIIKLDKEATNLEKFKDDAEEVADKLSKILKHKDDKVAIAGILRELKKTDYI